MGVKSAAECPSHSPDASASITRSAVKMYLPSGSDRAVDRLVVLIAEPAVGARDAHRRIRHGKAGSREKPAGVTVDTRHLDRTRVPFYLLRTNPTKEVSSVSATALTLASEQVISNS